MMMVGQACIVLNIYGSGPNMDCFIHEGRTSLDCFMIMVVR